MNISADGIVWTSLGNGTRITGGWQLTGLSLPFNQNHYVRARGYATGGYFRHLPAPLFESIRVFYFKRNGPIVDFDGDGKTDVAVYHSASGLWYIKPSSGAADYYVGYGGPVMFLFPGTMMGMERPILRFIIPPQGSGLSSRLRVLRITMSVMVEPVMSLFPGTMTGMERRMSPSIIKPQGSGISKNLPMDPLSMSPTEDRVLTLFSETLMGTGRRILSSTIKPQASGTSCNRPTMALTM